MSEGALRSPSGGIIILGRSGGEPSSPGLALPPLMLLPIGGGPPSRLPPPPPLPGGTLEDGGGRISPANMRPPRPRPAAGNSLPGGPARGKSLTGPPGGPRCIGPCAPPPPPPICGPLRPGEAERAPPPAGVRAAALNRDGSLFCMDGRCCCPNCMPLCGAAAGGKRWWGPPLLKSGPRDGGAVLLSLEGGTCCCCCCCRRAPGAAPATGSSSPSSPSSIPQARWMLLGQETAPVFEPSGNVSVHSSRVPASLH